VAPEGLVADLVLVVLADRGPALAIALDLADRGREPPGSFHPAARVRHLPDARQDARHNAVAAISVTRRAKKVR